MLTAASSALVILQQVRISGGVSGLHHCGQLTRMRGVSEPIEIVAHNRNRCVARAFNRATAIYLLLTN